jgi:hypothetical protein
MTRAEPGAYLRTLDIYVSVSGPAPEKYWPAVLSTLAPSWALRARGILDYQLLPRFGALPPTALRREAIEAWYGERFATVETSTARRLNTASRGRSTGVTFG